MTRKFLYALPLCLISAPAMAAPPPERIAPANTVELTMAPDLATLEAHWSRTQFARIYADPTMKAFFADSGPELFGLFELPDAIGLKWTDLKAVSGGPIASISMPLPGQEFGTVVVIDVTGHAKELAALLSTSQGKLKKSSAEFRQRRSTGQWRPSGICRTAESADQSVLLRKTTCS